MYNRYRSYVQGSSFAYRSQHTFGAHTEDSTSGDGMTLGADSDAVRPLLANVPEDVSTSTAEELSVGTGRGLRQRFAASTLSGSDGSAAASANHDASIAGATGDGTATTLRKSNRIAARDSKKLKLKLKMEADIEVPVSTDRRGREIEKGRSTENKIESEGEEEDDDSNWENPKGLAPRKLGGPSVSGLFARIASW
jgi:hypothetical protein